MNGEQNRSSRRNATEIATSAADNDIAALRPSPVIDTPVQVTLFGAIVSILTVRAFGIKRVTCNDVYDDQRAYELQQYKTQQLPTLYRLSRHHTTINHYNTVDFD